MCLAVPMKISRLLPDGRAVAERGKSEIEIDVSLLDSPEQGEYVIVHAGYALETIDTPDAEERIELLGDLAGDQERGS